MLRRALAEHNGKYFSHCMAKLALDKLKPFAAMSFDEAVPDSESKLSLANSDSLYTTPFRYIHKLYYTARRSDEKNRQILSNPVSVDTHLQVAVAIALPSVRRSKRGSVSEDHSDTLEYSIGFRSISLEQEKA